MLNGPKLISDDIAISINCLADVAERPVAANLEDRPPKIVERELLRSVGNVLSGMRSPFLDYARDAKSAAKKGNLSGVEEFTKCTTAVVPFGSAAFVTSLAASMPATFWLCHPGFNVLENEIKIIP